MSDSLRVNKVSWVKDDSGWLLMTQDICVHVETDDAGQQVETSREEGEMLPLGTYQTSRGDNTLFIDGQAYPCAMAASDVTMYHPVVNQDSSDVAVSSWTARGNKEKLARASEVTVNMGDTQVTVVAEQRKQYVIQAMATTEDTEPVKIGQFDGKKNIKDFAIELEGEATAFSDQQKAFLSVVGYQCLESRMVASTTIWTVVLLLTIPLIFLYFLGIL